MLVADKSEGRILSQGGLRQEQEGGLMHAVPLLFVGTIKIQRDDQRKMKQHKKNKSIIIAVITTQAGSQAPDLGEIRLSGHRTRSHQGSRVVGTRSLRSAPH